MSSSRSTMSKLRSSDDGAIDFDSIVIPLGPRKLCDEGCGTVLNRYNRSGICGACSRKFRDYEVELEGKRAARSEIHQKMQRRKAL